MTTPVTYGRGTPKSTATLTRVCAAIGAAPSASAIPTAKSTRFIGHLRPAFLERSCQTRRCRRNGNCRGDLGRRRGRSEEHTSELQSRLHLVCRLLLEKKKKKANRRH